MLFFALRRRREWLVFSRVLVRERAERIHTAVWFPSDLKVCTSHSTSTVVYEPPGTLPTLKSFVVHDLPCLRMVDECAREDTILVGLAHLSEEAVGLDGGRWTS